MVDLGRSCYTTRMIFDEAGTIEVPVVWYFAPDNAKIFPGEHLFGSAIWSPNGEIGLGPGEDWATPRVWSNGALPAPFTGQGPPCAPLDWWTDGVPPDAPPLLLDGRGVPVCCSVPVTFTSDITVDLTGQQNGQTWFPIGGPMTGRSIRSITAGVTYIVDTNSGTQFIAHDPTSVAVRVIVNAVGAFRTWRDYGVTITNGAQSSGMNIQSYDFVTGVAVYHVPAASPVRPNQFFRITIPL